MKRRTREEEPLYKMSIGMPESLYSKIDAEAQSRKIHRSKLMREIVKKYYEDKSNTSSGAKNP